MTGLPWNLQNKQCNIYISRTADEYSFSFSIKQSKVFCIFIAFVKNSGRATDCKN